MNEQEARSELRRMAREFCADDERMAAGVERLLAYAFERGLESGRAVRRIVSKAVHEAGIDGRKNGLEFARTKLRAHAEWLSEVGRVTDDERRVAVGALETVRDECEVEQEKTEELRTSFGKG